MKKFLALCIALFLILPFSVFAAPPGNPSDWILTFDDEFGGTALDTTKWDVTLSPGWQSQDHSNAWWDTTSAYHVVSDGSLKLVCDKVTEQRGYPYTCGVISAHNTFNQMYGYFEASLKLPAGGVGMWPAFWLMPKTSDNSWMWPPEIDVMEAQGALLTENFMTYHQSSNWPGTGGSDIPTTIAYRGSDFTADFHVFGVLWSPQSITWYIDGAQVAQTTMKVPLSGNGFPGMYMILDNSTADGTGFGAAVNGSTVFPNQLEVHYVRVYAANTAQPVISAVSVSPGPTSAAVTWTTDQDAASQVAFGLTSSYGSTTQTDPALTTSHSQTLASLAPGTTYHFAVISTNAAGVRATSQDYTFQTSANPLSQVIIASAGAGGSIAPSGFLRVPEGSSLTFGIAPNTGYSISEVLVDGSSVGALSSYTFSDVAGNHTIAASFTLDPSSHGYGSHYGRAGRHHGE